MVSRRRRSWRYEHHTEPPLSRAKFVRRLLAHLLVAGGVVGASLGTGMVGFMTTEHLSGLDAFLLAAMLLGREGPTVIPRTSAGRLFAGIYALYAGLVLVAVTAIMLVPVVHRLMHRYHWGGDSDETR